MKKNIVVSFPISGEKDSFIHLKTNDTTDKLLIEMPINRCAVDIDSLKAAIVEVESFIKDNIKESKQVQTLSNEVEFEVER